VRVERVVEDGVLGSPVPQPGRPVLSENALPFGPRSGGRIPLPQLGEDFGREEMAGSGKVL